MIAALARAELRKAATVRSTPFLLAAALIVEVAFKALLVALQDADQYASRAQQFGALGPTLFLPLAAATVGVLIAGAEWRYRLVDGSFRIAPSRTPVLRAQMLVAGALAAFLGLAAGGVSNALVGLILDGRTDLLLDARDGWTATLGLTVACALLAVAGTGVATLLRSQIAGLAVMTIVLFVLAPLGEVLVPELAAYLPYGATLGLAVQRESNDAYLGVLAAGAVLAAEVFVVAIAAARMLVSRDV